MTKQTKAFVQSLFVGGVEVDRTLLISAAYMESIDMSCPSLIVEINDQRGDMRDEIGLVEGAEIKIEFGNVLGADEALFIEKFIVSVAPIKSGVIKVEAFSKAVHQLKEPCVKPVFFVEESVTNILSLICKGLGLVVDCSVVGKATYHLNYDMTPSRLLRNIARDFGAAVWICRGVIHFHLFERLMTQKTFLKAGINSNDVDITITAHDAIRDKKLYERITQKKYHSWATDKGMQSSTTHGNKSHVIMAYPPQRQLDNLSKYFQPMMVFECDGMADFEPSKMIKFLMIRLSKDSEIDESMPSRMLITGITHFTQSNSYLNRIEVGILNE